MADSTISQLPLALTLKTTDFVPIERDGVTMRVPVSYFNPLVGSFPSLAGFINGADVSLTWNNTTRTLTVAPTGGAFQFYVANILFTKSVSEQISIPDVTGNYYFYYNQTGTLSVATAFTDAFITTYSFVSSLYWNDTTNLVVPDAISELHGAGMPTATHLYLHGTVGTVYDLETGGLLPSVTADGDGSLAAHIEFSATPGAVWDDDVRVVVPIKQISDNIPILYRTGAAGVWTFDETSPTMVRTTGTGRAAYNQFTGGAWQLTEATDTKYILMHLFVIPGITKKWMMIMGQNEYATLSAASDAAETEITTITGVPFAENKDIATFVIQTANTYTNSVKSRVVSLTTGGDFFDWRFSETGGAGASGTGGDVVGPVGATDGNVVLFNGSTGKIIKDSGQALSLFALLAGSTSQAFSTALLTVAGLHDISGAGAGQIKFPATQNPSSNANTLDDYKEGTVTLVLSGCTTTPTIDFKYTKIGRVVTLSPNAATITGISNSASKTLTGLPLSLSPTVSYYDHAISSDNGGAATISAVYLTSGGNFSLQPTTASASWTASGLMAWYPKSYTYITAA